MIHDFIGGTVIMGKGEALPTFIISLSSFIFRSNGETKRIRFFGENQYESKRIICHFLLVL
jgi:hypothetical protein